MLAGLEMSVPMIHSLDMLDWIFWNIGQRCYACNTQGFAVFRVPLSPMIHAHKINFA